MSVNDPWWRIEISAADIDEIGPELFGWGVQGIHEIAPGKAEVFWQGATPAAALDAVVQCGGNVLSVSEVPLENWVRMASNQWEPISCDAIHLDFVEEFAPQDPPPTSPAAPSKLRIVPGLGFGTGHHPTTRTLLELMQHPELQVWIAGQRERAVLDLGTGSGILAIAAATLWGAVVDAIEPDPLALENAAQNCRGNGVENLVTLREGDIAVASGPYAIIFANIYAEILCEIAAQLIPRCAPQGWLLLSGIMAEKAANVRDAYQSLALISEVTLNGWVSLLYRRSI